MVSGQVPRVIVIGGGAAGFFGAIACAENTNDGVDIRIFETVSYTHLTLPTSDLL